MTIPAIARGGRLIAQGVRPETLQLLGSAAKDRRGGDLYLPYYAKKIGGGDVELIAACASKYRSSRVKIEEAVMTRNDARKLLEYLSDCIHLKELSLERMRIEESWAIVGFDADEIDKDLKDFVKRSSSITVIEPRNDDLEIFFGLRRNKLVENAISNIALKIVGGRLALTLKNDKDLIERLRGNALETLEIEKWIYSAKEKVRIELMEGLNPHDILTIAGRFYSPIGQHIVKKIRVAEKNISWPSLFGQKILRLAEFPDYEIEVATNEDELERMGKESRTCIGAHGNNCRDDQHVMVLRNVRNGKVDATLRYRVTKKENGCFMWEREEVAGHSNWGIPRHVMDFVQKLEAKMDSEEISINFAFLEEARSERMKDLTLEDRLSSVCEMNLSATGLRRSIKGMLNHHSGGDHENHFKIDDISVSLLDPKKPFNGNIFKQNALKVMSKHCVVDCVGGFKLALLAGEPELRLQEVENRKEERRASLAPKPRGVVMVSPPSLPETFRDNR